MGQSFPLSFKDNFSSEDFNQQSENYCPHISQWQKKQGELEIIFRQNVSSLFNASITHNL